LKESLGEVQGTYQKGTHPYLRTLSLVALMMEEEARFALQCLPSTTPVSAVLNDLAAEWLAITQLICSIVQRSLDKRAFADQIFIFDLISSFAQLLQDSKSRGCNILELLHGSLGALASLGSAFLARLQQEIEQEGRQGSALPTPTNATVFEQTSSLLNCMRRMVEYDGVIEGLLGRLEQGEGPGVYNDATILALSDPSHEVLPLMASYYQQGLKWLEAAIEARAKTYRKPIQGLIFRLNNYRYIQRVLSSSYISGLVPIESERHYQEVLQQLRDQYMTSWKGITRILDANEPLTGSLGMGMATAKDRAKVFINEVAEAVKHQSILAVPDPEFRITLKEQVKKTVLEPFEDFYTQ
jgi:HPt (histidine-containing phosphotransfer) domain-containing protein